jgi:hypothetical protein
VRLNAGQARVFIVAASLLLSGVLLIFLMLAPALGVPFNENLNENVRLIEIVIPVFFGYLGSASHFVFNVNRGREIAESEQLLLGTLLIGAFAVFTIFISALFATFWITRGRSMDFDTLSRWFSSSMGLLACTVSILSSYLFGAPPSLKGKAGHA